MSASAQRVTIRSSYAPHARQRMLHKLARSGVGELLYGGAAGGGKTYSLVNEGHLRCWGVPNRRVVMFRRTYPQLCEAILPQMRQLAVEGAPWCEYREGARQMRYHNGSTFDVRYAETAADVRKYKGAQWDTLIIDEAGDWTWGEVSFLLSRVRTPLSELGVVPQLLMSSNPMGVGFEWLKERYVAPVLRGERLTDEVWTPDPSEDDKNPCPRVFIPALFSDNPSLDESYIDRLSRIASPQERAALMAGSWDLPADELALFQPGVIQAMQEATGFADPVPGHNYLHAWDLARARDWTVGITLDVTVLPAQIVAFERFRHIPWPEVADRISARHARYGGHTIYDSSGVGDPLGEFLDIPLAQLEAFKFTTTSKRDAVMAAVLAGERAAVRGPARGNGIEIMWSEMGAYRWDDKNLVQDCVMAVAMACYNLRLRVQGWTATRRREESPLPATPFRRVPRGMQQHNWMR